MDHAIPSKEDHQLQIVLVVENRLIKECRSSLPASSSTSTSSIGCCDDEDDPGNADEGSEVESPLRSGPLECMDSLESSLPLKRGLSQFFDGKSRSFTSLKEVSSTQQLSKAESPFNFKRRRLMNKARRIPASKSSSNFKVKKEWSPPSAFVRMSTSFLPRSFSLADVQRQHIISGVQNA